MTSNQAELLENEWYIVRYSGETPEIAYNSAIYFLTRAKDGPQLSIAGDQVDLLKKAAVDRYTEIILRDLYHGNCNKPIYRGIARSITNYRRFCAFCVRQQLGSVLVRSQAARALQEFLDTEIDQVRSTRRPSIINCTYKELKSYADELGVDLPTSEDGFLKLCLSPD
jgi:hypothetical protein